MEPRRIECPNKTNAAVGAVLRAQRLPGGRVPMQHYFFFREHWIRSTRPNAIQSLSGTDSRRRGSFPCEEWQERFPGKQGVVGDRRLTGGCVRTIRSQHAGILVDDPGC